MSKNEELENYTIMKKLFIISFLMLIAGSCKESRNTRATINESANEIAANSGHMSNNAKEIDIATNDSDSAATDDEKFIEGALYPFDKVFILNW